MVYDERPDCPILEQLAGFVEFRNLGNTRYEPANGFVIPGRTAVAGLRGTF